MTAIRITKFSTLSVLLAFTLLTLPFGAVQAKSAKEIDASANTALKRFKKEVKGANDYLNGAKGVLVVPKVKKAGFVIGAQWGEGVLRIGNKSVAYYKMDAGSVGFQAGYQEADFVFLFLTQEALENFQASKGWTAGVEGGITVVDASVGTSLDTLKAKSAIVAFVFGKEGLMAGWSAKGTKFTKMAK